MRLSSKPHRVSLEACGHQREVHWMVRQEERERGRRGTSCGTDALSCRTRTSRRPSRKAYLRFNARQCSWRQQSRLHGVEIKVKIWAGLCPQLMDVFVFPITVDSSSFLSSLFVFSASFCVCLLLCFQFLCGLLLFSRCFCACPSGRAS